jgi:hypothetical protein
MSLNRQFGLLLNAMATQMLVLFNNGGFSQVYLCLTYVLATCNLLHANAVPFGSLELLPFDHSKLTPI